MPWTAKDASKHKKGLNSAQAKTWAGVANGVLKSTGNEAEAIRTANARVGAPKARRKLIKGKR